MKRLSYLLPLLALGVGVYLGRTPALASAASPVAELGHLARGSFFYGTAQFTGTDGGSATCLDLTKLGGQGGELFGTNRGPAEILCGGDAKVTAANATLVIPAQSAGVPSTASVSLAPNEALCCTTAALQVSPNDFRYRAHNTPH